MEDYRHPEITGNTGRNLEIDFFYPRLNLAIEYQVTLYFHVEFMWQGLQHYKRVGMFHNQVENSFENDLNRQKQKRELLESKGITLIEIPYWWDKKLDSLQCTIYASKPEIFLCEPQGQVIGNKQS